MTFSVIHMNAFGIFYIKNLNIVESIKSYFTNRKDFDQLNTKGIKDKQIPDYISFTCDMDWMYETDTSAKSIQIIINNEFDICVRLK